MHDGLVIGLKKFSEPARSFYCALYWVIEYLKAWELSKNSEFLKFHMHNCAKLQKYSLVLHPESDQLTRICKNQKLIDVFY